MKDSKILVFATNGKGSKDEARILELIRNFSFYVVSYERTDKFHSFIQIIQQAFKINPKLVVMEGTGVPGGMACLLLRWFFHIPYIFSSGDAIAPFLSLNYPLILPIANIYEQILCRFCAGFIGWTPYLVGRALTFGAPKGLTAAGWADSAPTTKYLADQRIAMRKQLGIPSDSVVFGIVGSIVWIRRLGYCYGYELVTAFQKINRQDITILVVGDGCGLARLQDLAGVNLGKQVFLPGRVPLAKVLDYMAIMDVASLPQSVDLIGNFRYTTKVSEYIAANLPIVTSQIPMAYDIIGDWAWRLPGDKPWGDVYINALANLMETVTFESIRIKQKAILTKQDIFNKDKQIDRVTHFINELI